VIASDRGSIPEVAGNAALICDAEDDQALADLLRVVLTEPERAEMLRQLGYRRAAQFSWSRTAEQLLSCYTDVAVRSVAGMREVAA